MSPSLFLGLAFPQDKQPPPTLAFSGLTHWASARAIIHHHIQTNTHTQLWVHRYTRVATNRESLNNVRRTSKGSASYTRTHPPTHTVTLTHAHTHLHTHTLSRLHLDKLRLIFYILYSFFIFPKTRDRDFRTSPHQRNDSTTHIRSSNAMHRFRKVLCLVSSCSFPTALPS